LVSFACLVHAMINWRGNSSAHIPESCVNKIEYKVVLLPYKTGIFQADSEELAAALNKVGEESWRLSQIVLPSTMWGRANTMVAILERAKA
jgi:hypothetical protein